MYIIAAVLVQDNFPLTRLAAFQAGAFVWQTYKEVGEKVTKVASALRGVGVEPHERVGVYATNCPQWMMAMQVRYNTPDLIERLFDHVLRQ